MITFLSGGTGTPKLLQGMKKILTPNETTVIVNTAEDTYQNGVLICPDIDTVLYTLTDQIDDEKWWGIKNDTFILHEALKKFKIDELLKLGDQDRALCVYRTKLLQEGYTLTQATKNICKALSIESNILPMCNENITTKIKTNKGIMTFNEFWIKHHANVDVIDVKYKNIENSKLTSEIKDAILNSDRIIIGPSSPITSIGPILQVKDMKNLLKTSSATIIVISPIIGSRAFSGPTTKLMSGLGYDLSSLSILEMYGNFIDIFIGDKRDRVLANQCGIEINIKLTDISLNSMKDKVNFSKYILEL